jgi:hypothetical protein
MFKPIFARPVRQGIKPAALTKRFDCFEQPFLHLSMFTSHGVPVQFSKSDLTLTYCLFMQHRFISYHTKVPITGLILER